MPHPYTSPKKALRLAFILFFIALSFLIVYGSYWPGIILSIGLPLALRLFLLGRAYDALLLAFIFSGAFASFLVASQYLAFPVLFTIGALFLYFKDAFDPEEEEEVVEEIKKEMEEEDKN